MATSSVILQSYLYTFNSNKTEELRYDEQVEALLTFNKKAKGGDFLTPLSYYRDLLGNTDKVMFAYMNLDQKNQLLRDLQTTYLLLLTQKKYEQQHQKEEHVKDYDKDIKQCQGFIDALNYEQVCKDKEIKPAPEHGYATDGYPVQYLGISWGQWLASQMVAMMDRKTKTIKEAMGALNEKRLYWVWGSVLLKTVLELMPADFFNVDQAKQTIRTPDPYTGCLSWALYYFRFSLNLSLLLKHTISGPWMSEEEKSTPWTERFLTQWDQRKFTLLNDSLWATANIVCYFWLNGGGVLGTWGDALTIALLVFDISVTVWDFEEQKTQYNKEMLDYDINIDKLKKQLAEVTHYSDDDEPYIRQIKEYRVQLHALVRAQGQCQKDWDYKKLTLINNIAYAVGLMLAFILLTTPFLPITGAALTAVGVAGAVLCFAFTVIYNAVKGGMEINKTQTSAEKAEQDHKNKIKVLTDLIKQNSDLDENENEKRFIFLEIKKLKAETEYQKQMVVSQTMHLVRSILFEALVPALIFVNLVFLPLGIGFGVLGAIVALAILSNLLINNVFKPEKEPLTQFNETEYQDFCKDLDHGDRKSSTAQNFFKPTKEQPIAEAPQQNKLEKNGNEIDSLLLNDRLRS